MMKLAVAGKGGVGKTTICAWMADYLARSGEDVWLVDADTALSLGPALGLDEDETPIPLVQQKSLIQERVGTGGFINMNPKVDDLIARLSVEVRERLHLLVMGTIAGAGSGCGCAPNALLKALLVHLVFQASQHLLVDLEAGVEHLGRGTIYKVDGLVVVSEPSLRAVNTASQISALAADLGLKKQVLVLNRCSDDFALPADKPLPELVARFPRFSSLAQRQQRSPSVLDLPERDAIDALCARILQF
jgi:CO dehydrogenase maturation factor